MLKIKNLKEVQSEMKKQVMINNFRALEAFGERKVKELQEKAPVASGKLRDSIGMELKQGLKAKLEIFAKVLYAQSVSSGIEPGNLAKISSLRDWGRFKSSLSDDRIFKIRRRIFERGIKKNTFWTSTFKNVENDLKKIYKEVAK